jgi:hypothetical protein
MIITTILTTALAGAAPNGAALAEMHAVSVAPLAVDDAQEQYDALEKTYNDAQAAFRTAFEALRESDDWKTAQEEGDRSSLQTMYEELEAVDDDAHAQKFLDAAKTYEGKATEVMFLQKALQMTRNGEIAGSAVEGLISRHLDSPAWEEVSLTWVYLSFSTPDRFDAFTDQVIENSKSDLVKAQVMYGKAQAIQYSVGRGEELSDESKAEVAELHAQVMKLAPNSIAAMEINGPKFEEENLQIGMTVPEMEGPDTAGENFKLSDYRGKVVLLDFWGDW